jgi:G3E family GTPase
MERKASLLVLLSLPSLSTLARPASLSHPLLLLSPFTHSQLLDERSPDALDEVVNQIAFADTILLNKIDLVSPEDLQHARDLVRAVNVTANLIECQLKDSDVADGAIAPGAGGAAVTWDTVMDVNSFSIERALQVDPTFMDDSANKDGDHEGDDEDDEDDGEDDAEEEEEDAATTAGRDGQPGTGGPPSTRARSREATAAVRKRGRAGSRGGSASTGGGGVGVGGDSVGGGGGGDAAKRAAGALPAAQRWRRQSLHDLAGVSSVGISAAGPLDQYRFNMFMKDLLLEKARDIMRCKGVLCIAGQERTRFVFQGVHDTVCFGPSAQGWDPDAPGPPVSQIVFIGRNLDRAMLSEGFRSCVWSPLPAGWTEHLDDRSGRPYFVCPATGAKQWTRPMGDAGTGGAAGVEVTEAPLRASLEGGGKVASPPAVAGAPQA